MNDTPEFFPVATDVEVLLSSVFGEVPKFSDPRRRRNDAARAATDPETQHGVTCCRVSLYQSFVSQFPPTQRRDPIRRLIAAVAPGTVPETRRPRQLTPAFDKKLRKGRKHKALSPQPRQQKRPRPERVTVLEGAADTKSDIPVKLEPDAEGPNERTLEQKEDLAQQGHPNQGDVVPFVFADVLLRCDPEIHEAARGLRSQFPSRPSTAPEAAAFSGSSQSPLLSVPGLISDMQLFYATTGMLSPYCRTWENKIQMRWSFCKQELLTGLCQDHLCTSQHRRQYDLDNREKLQYSRSVGTVDRQRLTGQPASFLHWPKPPSTKCLLLETLLLSELCSLRTLKDDVPLYGRTVEAEGSSKSCLFVKSQSSLLRGLRLDLDRLRRGGIQLCMDYTVVDALTLLQSASQPRPADQHPSPRDGSGVASDEVDVLEMALSMIEGEQWLHPVSRQTAMKFLSKKLAVLPHERMLWQLYLALFLRDESETIPSKLHQAQLCTSICGPWYRASLMVAAVKRTPEEKISTYRETIHSLFGANPTSALSPRVSACCLDLALRMIHIELSATKKALGQYGCCLRDVVEVMKSGAGGCSVVDRPEHGQIRRLLEAVGQDAQQSFVFSLAVARALLYQQLPPFVIHSLGFPKRLELLNWSAHEMSGVEFDAACLAVKWAWTAGQQHKTESPESLSAKEIFVANAMRMCMKLRDRTKALTSLQLIFGGSLSEVQFPDTSVGFLHVAQMLDKEICSGEGGGFVTEQIMSHFLNQGHVSVLKEWIRTMNVRPPPRVALAMAKAELLENCQRSDMQLRNLSLEAALEDGGEWTGEGEEAQGIFFKSLSSFYGRLLRRESIDIEAFLRRGLALCQDSPALTERLWMELIVLLAVALPQDDPRKQKQDPDAMVLDQTPEQTNISYAEMRSYMAKREAAFCGWMAVLEVYVKNHVQAVEALDNFVEDVDHLPENLRSALAPPQLSQISPFLEHLRMICPLLHEHEVQLRRLTGSRCAFVQIMKCVELLCTSFPTSPSLATFLIETVLPSVSHFDRSCLSHILTLLLHSIPAVGFSQWLKVIDLSYKHGQCLGRELSAYAKQLYPHWKCKARL